MSSKITKNEIPSIGAIKKALLDVLASGRARSFDNIGASVAAALGLTRAQRAYRIGQSKNSLFENRLVQARAELTKEGAITYRSGKVKLADRGAGATEQRAESDVASDAGKGRETRSGKAPEGRPTKCLSFQEPYASYIATGVKDAEFRSRKVNVPIRDLVVCASKTAREHHPIPGLAYGFAVGMVDVVECAGIEGDRVWKLENPRLIKPFEVHATAGFFYVADIPEVIPNDEESYREHILPHCFSDGSEIESEMIASLFSPVADEVQKAFEIDQDKFDLAKKEYPYNRQN